MNEAVDIMLGDVWLEPYVSDGLGTNIVIVRNDHLSEALTTAVSEQWVKLFDESSRGVAASQRSLDHISIERSTRLSRWGSSALHHLRSEWESHNQIGFVCKRLQIERLKAARKSYDAFDKYYSRDDVRGYLGFMKKTSWQYRKLHQMDRLLRMTRMPLRGILGTGRA
jgi:hypothetical protein